MDIFGLKHETHKWKRKAGTVSGAVAEELQPRGVLITLKFRAKVSSGVQEEHCTFKRAAKTAGMSSALFRSLPLNHSLPEMDR